MVAGLVARARAAGLDQLLPADVPDTPDNLATAYIAHWLTGGSEDHGRSPSVLSLAREMGVSPGLLYAYIWHDEERKAAVARARELAAHLLVDQGLERLDDADPFHAALANSQANYRRWLAGVFNREAYGEGRQAITGSINIGELHLHAHQVIKQLPAYRHDAGEEPAQLEAGQEDS
jgi:hypothetical protein